MAENPLLPDNELRALLAATQRCTKLDQAAARLSVKHEQVAKRRSKSAQVLPTREALLAATTMQLRFGDLLITEPGDVVAADLAPRTNEAKVATEAPIPAQQRSRLLLATAMAAALKATGTDKIVVVFTRTNSAEDEWARALAWAQTKLLPLVLVCGDTHGRQAFQVSSDAHEAAFTWSAVSRAARKLGLPILAADGEDAVAMYRVMQESVLRARSGGGPAILWAVLPTKREIAGRPAADLPLARLRRYLRSRKIALQ